MKATLTWEALREVDAEMAAVAWELAREYGYGAEPDGEKLTQKFRVTAVVWRLTLARAGL